MATRNQDRRKGRQLAVLLVAGLCSHGFSSPALADVIEVAPDGTTTLRSGTGAVRRVGAAGRDEIPGEDVGLSADVSVPAGAVLDTRSRAPAAYAAAVARIAARYDISPAILEALVWQESRWQPNALSRAGAVGLAQLMPATAHALGVDARDPVANLEGGARFLRAQLDRFGGDVEKALAAYNAGPARVHKAGGIPAIAETRAYVAAIIGRLASTPTGE